MRDSSDGRQILHPSRGGRTRDDLMSPLRVRGAAAASAPPQAIAREASCTLLGARCRTRASATAIRTPATSSCCPTTRVHAGRCLGPAPGRLPATRRSARRRSGRLRAVVPQARQRWSTSCSSGASTGAHVRAHPRRTSRTCGSACSTSIPDAFRRLSRMRARKVFRAGNGRSIASGRLEGRGRRAAAGRPAPTRSSSRSTSFPVESPVGPIACSSRAPPRGPSRAGTRRRHVRRQGVPAEEVDRARLRDFAPGLARRACRTRPPRRSSIAGIPTVPVVRGVLAEDTRIQPVDPRCMIQDHVGDAAPIDDAVLPTLEPAARARELARGTRAAPCGSMHDWGLRHRDLKRDNVFLRRDGGADGAFPLPLPRSRRRAPDEAAASLDWDRRARDLSDARTARCSTATKVPTGLRLRVLDAYLDGQDAAGPRAGASSSRTGARRSRGGRARVRKDRRSTGRNDADPVGILWAFRSISAPARRGTDMGPSAIRLAGLTPGLQRLGVEVRDQGYVAVAAPETRDPGRDRPAVRARDPPHLRTRLRHRTSRSILGVGRDGRSILGGDHSIAMGSGRRRVAGHYAQQGRNRSACSGSTRTPTSTRRSSSPSGNVHGMPLATILGHGDPLARRPRSRPRRWVDKSRTSRFSACADVDAGEKSAHPRPGHHASSR